MQKRKRIRRIRENREGFTLIEMLAVLVIIAISAAVAIPTMSGFIRDAQMKSFTSQARNVYVAAQAAALDMESNGMATTGMTEYTRDDGTKYIERVEKLLGDDVEQGSMYKITLDGNKVENIEYTPENGKKITIAGGEGVTYEED